MKRGDTSKVELLSPGDRFYFLADKKKRVWEVVTQKNTAFKYGVLSTKIKDGKDGDYVKKGRDVVFLRNINDKES